MDATVFVILHLVANPLHAAISNEANIEAHNLNWATAKIFETKIFHTIEKKGHSKHLFLEVRPTIPPRLKKCPNS